MNKHTGTYVAQQKKKNIKTYNKKIPEKNKNKNQVNETKIYSSKKLPSQKKKNKKKIKVHLEELLSNIIDPEKPTR